MNVHLMYFIRTPKEAKSQRCVCVGGIKLKYKKGPDGGGKHL